MYEYVLSDCLCQVYVRAHQIWINCQNMSKMIFYCHFMFGFSLSVIKYGFQLLILLHSEQPKLHGVLAVLSAVGLKQDMNNVVSMDFNCRSMFLILCQMHHV